MRDLPSVAILTASYNDWPSLATLLPLIDDTLAGVAASVRVVCVDDGSIVDPPADLLAGRSWQVIESVDVVRLLRNLGNQRALSVGLGWLAANIDADYVVVMDCDHEDRPEVIPELLAAAASSGKICFAARTSRHEGPMFKVFYAAYKRLYKLLTGMPVSFGNFSAIPGKMVKRLAGVWEIGLHFPAGVMKSRLPYGAIGAARGKRLYGQSSMNIANLLVHGFSGMAVHAEIVSARVVLVALGVAMGVLGYMGFALFEKFVAHSPPLGWTSQILAVFLGVLLQILVSALLLLFLVLSGRQQRPFIPLRDHSVWVMDVVRLGAAGHNIRLPGAGQSV